MYPWLRQSLIDARDVAGKQLVMRHQRTLDRVRRLDLRDRWGYPLEDYKVAEIIDFVLEDMDWTSLKMPKRQAAVIVELADRLALAMLTDLPMFCDGYDTPPSDETIQTVVRSILNIKESS